jgi:hypothetical protein
VCAAWLLLPAGGRAQDALPAPRPDDTRERIERLEKELQELKARLPAPAEKAADSGTGPKGTDEKPAKKDEGEKGKDGKGTEEKGKDDSKKKTDEEKEEEKKGEEKKDEKAKEFPSFVVGDDLGPNVSWDARGFRFRSKDEAFSLHLGGRLMVDAVWWDQSPRRRASSTQPPGSPLGLYSGVGPGIGDLEDAFYIRRARFVADGQIYQTIEFKTEFDFENYNSIAFDESYVGARDLPFIDTVRVGQTHVPFGLEAYTSSRFLPQLERSPQFDAFYQEFAPASSLTRPSSTST